MKKYIKVGYVKFASKKSREELKKDDMVLVVLPNKKNPVNPKEKVWLFSREDGKTYPCIVGYSTDKYFSEYYYECECRKVTEISKNRFKYENTKIPYGYHLYRANIYLPINNEFEIDCILE